MLLYVRNDDERMQNTAATNKSTTKMPISSGRWNFFARLVSFMITLDAMNHTAVSQLAVLDPASD